MAGAGGELGRATALTLADRGFTVVGVDRNKSGLKLPDRSAREVADATDPEVARGVAASSIPKESPIRPFLA